MELALTNEEANYLLNILKSIFKSHSINLEERPKDTIIIKAFGDNQREFRLSYFYTESKKQFNFLDYETKCILVRINLDNNFHKNANGEKIYGNRVNIFSEEEFIAKGDGHTHYKCYPLPYDSIEDTNDFFEMLDNVFEYTSTEKQGNIKIESIQQVLEI